MFARKSLQQPLLPVTWRNRSQYFTQNLSRETHIYIQYSILLSFQTTDALWGKASCMQKRLISVIWLGKFQREREFKLFIIVQVYGARWFEHFIDRFEQSTWEPSVYNLPMLDYVVNKS